jgi:hypothetical protein
MSNSEREGVRYLSTIAVWAALGTTTSVSCAAPLLLQLLLLLLWLHPKRSVYVYV